MTGVRLISACTLIDGIAVKLLACRRSSSNTWATCSCSTRCASRRCRAARRIAGAACIALGVAALAAG
jgi:hypothetical protein